MARLLPVQVLPSSSLLVERLIASGCHIAIDGLGNRYFREQNTRPTCSIIGYFPISLDSLQLKLFDDRFEDLAFYLALSIIFIFSTFPADGTRAHNKDAGN